MEVQHLLGGVLAEPLEDEGEGGETKGRGIAFDQNAVVEAEAAVEVEEAGTDAVAAAEVAAGALVITSST